MAYSTILPVVVLTMALTSVFETPGQAIRPILQDPQPYAPIANPFADTVDQKVRDSANLVLSPIRVNQAGYMPGETNVFYSVGAATQFTVHDAQTKAQVGVGNLTSKGFSTSGSYSVKASNNAQLITGGDNRYTMVGAPLAGPVQEGQLPKNIPEGRYFIKINGANSAPFIIRKETYSYVRDALLKFFGIQRSGNSESWFHGPTHTKDGIPGGWYDCGDHLKEAQTQGFAIAVLGLTSAALPNRDADHYAFNQARTVNTDGVPDILREAKHGADFILAAYTAAGGVPGMTTSVGGFGQDHNWWGRPEFQDFAPTERGGPARELRSELGANVVGLYAAGLAFVSKQWLPYDAAYADKILKAARALYAYGKTNAKASNSPAYNGGGVISDDMALAAIALAWATGEKEFADDVFRNKTLGNRTDQAGLKGTFTAGWFVYENPTPLHGNANTTWATTHLYGLWAFYRLILVDPVLSTKLGIPEPERLALIRDVAYAVVRNISQLAGVTGGAGATIPIPDPQVGMTGGIPYNANWNINLAAEQVWVYNRYLAGNMTELFIYYDIAKDIQGLALPGITGAENWKAAEARQLLIRSFDYMLGINPWDLSLVYGIGAKTPNHPHHRAANPEGKNFPGAFYRYNPPVGALYGGYPPATANLYENWNDYHHSESCLDGTTALLLPTVGLAGAEPPLAPPLITVEVLSVDQGEALIHVRQSRYGKAVIRYGTTKITLGTSVPGLEIGVEHKIVLKGLQPGTTYYFEAEAEDIKGNKAVNDNGGEKWSFTTLKNPKDLAKISQVRACNISADSADILWFTPNGEYESEVAFGSAKPPTQIQSGDIAGQPVRFHRVRIGGLKEKTQYWFSVTSEGSKDNNQGQFYTFTTPVTHVAFEIRALQYSGIGPFPYLGINVVNNDVKAYDSLDLRIYLRGTEAEMKDFGAAVDVGIQYTEAGFQGTPFKGELDPLVQAQKPTKMEDTFDATTNTYIWYLSLPLGSVVMKSGARFRMDVGFRKRNLPFDQNLLYGPPTHVPTPLDWSWSPHTRAKGDPVDYSGIPTGSKDDLDNFYFLHPENPYITVYRKGEFVYGYSPSHKEQSTKVSHYEMTSRILSPIANPPEEHLLLDQPASVLNVKGTASISENGRLTDIWLNGMRMENIDKVAKYDPISNSYTLNIPVPLKAGANVVDITLFGGAEPGCTTCSGCAFSNHHFFVDFRKSDAFPSQLQLQTLLGTPLPPLAEAGKTQFQIEVTDKSGDRTALTDTLRVEISNANRNAAIFVDLIEIGVKTGIFKTASLLSLADVDPASITLGQVPFGEGDTVWVTYRDPSDPEDSSQAFVYAPATYPVAQGGTLYDTDGDGIADKGVVRYSKPLVQIPDSIQVNFPSALEARMAKGTGNLKLEPTMDQVSITWSPTLPLATSFSGDSRNTGRSFLTIAAKPRTNVFTWVDSLGPVLMKAILAPARAAGEADTLSLVFSEPVTLSPNVRHPLRMIRGTELGLDQLEWVKTLTATGENWKILVLSHSDPLIKVGDSLRLDLGFADLGGVKPHPRNRAIVLEGENRLPPPILKIRFIPASKGYFNGSFESDLLPAFIVRSSDEIENGITHPTLEVETDGPFSFETRVYDNLGAVVASWMGRFEMGQLNLLKRHPTSGIYTLHLQWNVRSNSGQMAGTGAYIWKIKAQSLLQAGMKQGAAFRLGYLRSN